MTSPSSSSPLSRGEASAAINSTGWRYLLANLRAWVPVRSLAQASEVAAAVVAASGEDADGHLRIDLRPDGVELSLQSNPQGQVTGRDAELAQQITEAVGRLGLRVAGATSAESARPVQMLEMAIDAIDIPAIRPFWKAVLGYVGAPNDDGPEGALVDPAGQMPAVWFQQMDAPRPQRNRVHFDVTVAHDEAKARVGAAIAAGGHLVNSSFAPSFWVLADVEDNKACVCTWTGREPTRDVKPTEPAQFAEV